MFHSSSARRLAVFPAVAAFAALATLSAAVALAQPASAQPEAGTHISATCTDLQVRTRGLSALR